MPFVSMNLPNLEICIGEVFYNISPISACFTKHVFRVLSCLCMAEKDFFSDIIYLAHYTGFKVQFPGFLLGPKAAYLEQDALP